MRHRQDSKTTVTEYIDYMNRSFKIITYYHYNARYQAHGDAYYLVGKCKINYIHMFVFFFVHKLKPKGRGRSLDFVSGVELVSSAPTETRRYFGTRATYVS